MGGARCDIAGVRATTDSNLTGGGWGGGRKKTQGKHNSPERCCVASRPSLTEAATLKYIQCAVLKGAEV
jgi:hypothetical protein